jgi:hypothetical protein
VSSKPDQQCYRRLTIHKKREVLLHLSREKQIELQERIYNDHRSAPSPEPVGWFCHHQLYSGCGSRHCHGINNYEFELIDYEPSETGRQYVFWVSPKSISKYVYRGKVWVDETDFAVTRIEAQPAQKPSFWTKKTEIHHEYKKVQRFWLPIRNKSVSYIRLGGRATLTIEYKDYRVTDARAKGLPVCSQSRVQ